jgi:BASS family bile acid:Na+ symporter
LLRNAIDNFSLALLGVATLTAFVAGCFWIAETNREWLAPLVATATLLASLAIASHSQMRTYVFAAWVVCFVFVAIIYPSWFLQIGPIEGVSSLTYLIQIAMFGMGATLTTSDFARVVRMPKGVAVGMLLQFSVMPLLGWSLAKLFALTPEIGAGLILVGACPGGVSSNVITYLAKGNVALSVTMTACSTLASPIMTPLMMYLLAGKSVPINYVDMFLSILFTVVVPVVAGLICNGLLQRSRFKGANVESYLATLSMIAICFICGIIAANSSQAIQEVGWLLLLAVLLHNVIGYLLGYFGAKAASLNEADSRTVAIEVGLQNGGMAAMLATKVLKLPAAAIAPALFAPVMNVSGSLLAAWWSRYRTSDGAE